MFLKKQYIYLDLFYEFRFLPEQIQLQFVLKRLLLFKSLYDNEFLTDKSDYQLSKRQIATKESMSNNIKSGELVFAYCEFLDYIEDYGLSHNDVISYQEMLAIKDNLQLLEDAIKSKLEDKDVQPEKNIDCFVLNNNRI